MFIIYQLPRQDVFQTVWEGAIKKTLCFSVFLWSIKIGVLVLKRPNEIECCGGFSFLNFITYNLKGMFLDYLFYFIYIPFSPQLGPSGLKYFPPLHFVLTTPRDGSD